jgi:hypothetical protein
MNFDRATKIIHFNDKYATELLKPLFFPRFVSIIVEQLLYSEFLVSIIHTYDAVGKMEPGQKTTQLAESSLSMLLWPTMLLVMPGMFLRCINHWFGSSWNHKLEWFIHVFCNTGNIVLMASALQSIINKVKDQGLGKGPNPVEQWHVLAFGIYFWAYAFHNHKLMLNKITELFIIYEIVQTIIWAGFQIDEVDKRTTIPGCDGIHFYGDKTPFDKIEECYRFVAEYQDQAKSNMNWFF